MICLTPLLGSSVQDILRAVHIDALNQYNIPETAGGLASIPVLFVIFGLSLKERTSLCPKYLETQ